MTVVGSLAALLAAVVFHAAVQPLPTPLRAQLATERWQAGCPVPLSQLRLVTVSHWGFDRRAHTGRLVVAESAAAPLVDVFRRLYALRFPIRRIDPLGGADDTYGFHCHRSVRSPCAGAVASTRWSDHAYGTAVDLSYSGCGRTTDSASARFRDRSRLRGGMVTPAVVDAFRAIGWGWGGYWRESQDYMHVSASGR